MLEGDGNIALAGYVGSDKKLQLELTGLKADETLMFGKANGIAELRLLMGGLIVFGANGESTNAVKDKNQVKVGFVGYEKQVAKKSPGQGREDCFRSFITVGKTVRQRGRKQGSQQHVAPEFSQPEKIGVALQLHGEDVHGAGEGMGLQLAPENMILIKEKIAVNQDVGADPPQPA